jgi:hypothetical protein
MMKRLRRGLAVLVVMVAVSAIAASAAFAGSGAWHVHSGRTLQLTNMQMSACDADSAYIFVDGSQFDLLGNNDTVACGTALPDYSYAPTDGKTHVVTLELVDNTAGCSWFSTGPNAATTRTAFAINDGGGVCAIAKPTLPFGNFYGSVSIFRTP